MVESRIVNIFLQLWQRMVAVVEEGREPLVVDPTEFMTKLRYSLASCPGPFSCAERGNEPGGEARSLQHS